MSSRWCALVGIVALASWQAGAQGPASPLDAALAAHGDLKSLRFTATGSSFNVGQNPRPEAPWPISTLKSFTASIDYDTPAMRIDLVRVQTASPPAGVVAQTVAGEQRQTQIVSGTHAWNLAGENATPAPAAVADRLLQVWLTPHGFLKAAKAGNATARAETVRGRKLTRVSFTAQGRRMSGLLDEQHRLERISTIADNPVLGDMPIEVAFSDYRSTGGVLFPGRIVHTAGGFPSLDLTVTEVAANPEVALPVPPNVQGAAAPALKVDSQKLADGVWYITGGSHHSVAVEFKDHVAVIEAPLNEERSLLVIGEVKRVVPGKPIKYLVNTHHHFDHAGGLRTYVAEGATIVTHQVNRRFYQDTLSAVRTLKPDRQSEARRKPGFEAVTDRKVLTDGAMTMELHHIRGNPHHDGFLMAYLPGQKLLVEVDAFSPPPPNTPPPATPNPNAVNLYENIQRLKLDVGQIVPLHGRVVPLADLAAFIGRTPSS